MKTLFSLLLTFFSFTFVFAQDLKVNYANTAPICDGIIDENDPWDNDNWIELGNYYQESTTDEMSAQFQLLHNMDFIYFALKVQDSTSGNHINIWQNDCSEIIFAMDTLIPADETQSKGCWLLWSRRTPEVENEYHDGFKLFDNENSIQKLTNSNDFNFASTDNGHEYTQEFIFPKNILVDNSNFDNKYFRFDARVFDNTGIDRTARKFWFKYMDTSWTTIHNTGVIQLLTKTETSSKNNRNNLTESIRVRNNELILKHIEGIITIYNLQGQTVIKATAKENTSIDITELNAGMYLFKVGRLSAKFIKR